MEGPYYAEKGEAWKAADGSPVERAFVRGPGLEGTLIGTTAHAEARARAEQLNVAYAAGGIAAERRSAELVEALARNAKRKVRGKARRR